LWAPCCSWQQWQVRGIARPKSDARSAAEIFAIFIFFFASFAATGMLAGNPVPINMAEAKTALPWGTVSAAHGLQQLSSTV
jgi:hypothetical protein